jgi:HPt (histidine-containing phosphotransfer) domain-containing protein
VVDEAGACPAQPPLEEAGAQQRAGTPSSLPINRAEAIERLDTDAANYDALLRLWLQKAPPEIARLAEAVEHGEARAVGTVAHKLKGACAYVGAERMRQIAQRLEAIGRSGQLCEAPAALAELEREFKRAAEFIDGG